MTGRSRIVVDPANAVFVYDKKQLKKVMRQAGAEVAASAKRMIRASGGGRVYRGSGGAKYRPYRRGRYTASAPGQAPANVTGTLLASIKVRPFKSGEGVAVRAGAFYAVFLEGGAKGGRGASRVLQPRPFLSQALDAKQASLGDRIRAAVADGVTFKRQR